MKLVDYNTLAFEFAIRNPMVIELLGVQLNDEVVKELLTYGIDATSFCFYEDTETPISSLQELYLDYDHLMHIKHSPHSPYGEEQTVDADTYEIYDNFKGNRQIVHPLSKRTLCTKELEEDAIPRIKDCIETRGKKLQRLTDKIAFENYDAITFFGETVYSIDPSANTAKTIRSDIKFISEWIEPNKYLQLIPQYKSILGRGK